MKSREDWMEEVLRRQDNIDPIRRIPNGALFQGTLINGNRRLNTAQRIGAVIIGISALVFGCLCLAQLIAALRAWRLPGEALYEAIFCPFSLWVGWKITAHALINHPRTPQPKRN
jgi:hypothetical protein